jgi:hypothetical protein
VHVASLSRYTETMGEMLLEVRHQCELSGACVGDGSTSQAASVPDGDTASQPSGRIALRGASVGAAEFGDDRETVIELLPVPSDARRVGPDPVNGCRPGTTSIAWPEIGLNLLFDETDKLFAYRVYVPDDGGAATQFGVQLTVEESGHSFGASLDDVRLTFPDAEVDEFGWMLIRSEGALMDVGFRDDDLDVMSVGTCL